jgi:hypothetical protein
MSTRLAFWKHPAWFACLLSTSGLLQADAGAPRPGGGTERVPLWQTAIKLTREKGNYVAASVRTEIKVFDGDEKWLGTVTEEERMERSTGKRRWKAVSRKQDGNPGMMIEADFGLQADPATVLEGYDEWHLLETGQSDGRAIEVWEGITKADPQNTVIASLDVESGFPRKAELAMPFHFPLISQVAKITLTYAPAADGVWLPATSVCDQRGRFLLIKRHIRLTKTYTDWEAAGP